MFSKQDLSLFMSLATAPKANQNPHEERSTSRSTEVWAKHLLTQNEDHHDHKNLKNSYNHNRSLADWPCIEDSQKRQWGFNRCFKTSRGSTALLLTCRCKMRLRNTHKTKQNFSATSLSSEGDSSRLRCCSFLWIIRFWMHSSKLQYYFLMWILMGA